MARFGIISIRVFYITIVKSKFGVQACEHKKISLVYFELTRANYIE